MLRKDFRNRFCLLFATVKRPVWQPRLEKVEPHWRSSMGLFVVGLSIEQDKGGGRGLWCVEAESRAFAPTIFTEKQALMKQRRLSRCLDLTSRRKNKKNQVIRRKSIFPLRRFGLLCRKPLSNWNRKTEIESYCFVYIILQKQPFRIRSKPNR